ncbi:MAG: hypothetical protein ACJ73U_15350, partial [Actinophytocola sp.]
ATAQPILRGQSWSDEDFDFRPYNQALRTEGYDFDPARRPATTTVWLAGTVTDVEQWDPLTGTAMPAPSREVDGGTEVTVSFESAPAVLLVWSTREAEPPAAAASPGAGVPSAGAGRLDSGESVVSAGRADSVEPAARPGGVPPVFAGRLDSAGSAVSADPADSAEPPAAAARSGSGAPPVPAGRLDSGGSAVSAGRVDSAEPLVSAARPGAGVPSAGAGRLDSGGSVVSAGRADSAASPLSAGRPGPAVSASVTALALDGLWMITLTSPVTQWRPWHRTGDGEWRQVLVTHGEFARMRVDDGDWRPVEYSLSRGIEKDPLHVAALGPKGRVPEEFWHADDARTVRLRTTLPVPPGRRTLAIAANGAIEAWWNGARLPADPGGYLRLFDVECLAANELEVLVRSEEDGPLRGYWTLTDDPAAFARPEWLTPADRTRRGSTVRAMATLTTSEPGRVTVQLGTEGVATFLVNGTEVAVSGAFDPYGARPNPRVMPHEIDLAAGENRLEVVFRDMGTPVSLIFDGPDCDWTWTRDGVPVPSAFRRRQSYDARWPLLHPRPHPLPRATWLDGAPTTGVLDVVPDSGHERQEEWFRLAVPPGAHRVRLPLVGETTAWVDGVELTGEDLPAGRELLIRVRPADGRTGGALWEGPAEFDCAQDPGWPPAPDFQPTGDPRQETSFEPPATRSVSTSPSERDFRMPGGPPVSTLPEGADGSGVRAEVVHNPMGEEPDESSVGVGRAPGSDASGGCRRESEGGVGGVDNRFVEVGPWEGFGLGSYSGGVSYHREVHLDRPGAVVLDLGVVRGTAEVWVNGAAAGVRIWSPYRFELTGLVRDGVNRLTVTVFNTLGPLLDDISPTAAVYAGQRVSGILGPVRLLV